MPLRLDEFAAVLLDFDGTLCRKERSLPGAREFVARLEREARRWAVLSNSTRGPRNIAERLRRAGIEIAPEHIYTATAAACDWVCQQSAGRDGEPSVFNLATADVEELLAGRAKVVDAGPEESSCDAVIVGTPSDSRATPDRQRLGLLHVRAGATLVGTSGDRVFPSGRGLELGAGALTAMLAFAADVEPVFTGKPEPIFFRELCTRLGVDPAECLLIGDNVEADIMGGRRLGMTTILVLTGVTGREELADLPDDRRPDRVVESVADLLGQV